MNRKWMIAVVLAAVTLAACGEKPIDAVYNHLEAAVDLEDPFIKQQEPLQKAELKENELFEKIVSLGMDDAEQIDKLAEEALTSIEERVSLIEKEKESIEASKGEFAQVKEQLELFDKETGKILNELIDYMNVRYDHYTTLYNNYAEAIKRDRTLFEMFKDQEGTLEELQAQIDLVNESYEKVAEAKKQFNRSTNLYNDKKKSFYEAMDLQVHYQ
ncbi:hypothetical protein GN156_01830 [bacterium LRH843]|nr:hypothetical protein [bacterium LRH843]